MYNPYFIPYASAASRGGLLSNIFSNISFSSILNGTSKALNVVNQSIPLIKQASPIIKNAKTMFKVMSEFKRDDNTSTATSDDTNKTSTNEIRDTRAIENGPTFFM